MPTIVATRVEGEEAVLTIEVRVPVSALTETTGGHRRRFGKDKQLQSIRKALRSAVK